MLRLGWGFDNSKVFPSLTLSTKVLLAAISSSRSEDVTKFDVTKSAMSSSRCDDATKSVLVCSHFCLVWSIQSIYSKMFF